MYTVSQFSFGKFSLDFLKKRKEHLSAIAIGIILALTILIIRPFGMRYEINDTIFQMLILSYALITSGVILFNESIIKKTTVRKFSWEYLNRSSRALWFFYQLSSIFIICLLAFLLSDYSFIIRNNWTVLIIGLQLTIFILAPIMISVSWLYRKSSDMRQSPTVRLRSSAKNDDLYIKLVNLYFIKCEDNYASIYYREDGNNIVKRKLIRSTLTQLSKQLEVYNVLRCHRSYILNSDQVQMLKGNRKKMRAILKNTSHVIPISRKYVEHFIRKM